MIIIVVRLGRPRPWFIPWLVLISSLRVYVGLEFIWSEHEGSYVHVLLLLHDGIDCVLEATCSPGVLCHFWFAFVLLTWYQSEVQYLWMSCCGRVVC